MKVFIDWLGKDVTRQFLIAAVQENGGEIAENQGEANLIITLADSASLYHVRRMRHIGVVVLLCDKPDHVRITRNYFQEYGALVAAIPLDRKRTRALVKRAMEKLSPKD